MLDVRGSVIFNEAGGDNDVRMEGDTDANLFMLDASTDRIGIGTATPNETLTVEGGVMSLKETTTPTATTNYGKIYTKTDNKLYFQDGAGTEHEIVVAVSSFIVTE